MGNAPWGSWNADWGSSESFKQEDGDQPSGWRRTDHHFLTAQQWFLFPNSSLGSFLGELQLLHFVQSYWAIDEWRKASWGHLLSALSSLCQSESKKGAQWPEPGQWDEFSWDLELEYSDRWTEDVVNFFPWRKPYYCFVTVMLPTRFCFFFFSISQFCKLFHNFS